MKSNIKSQLILEDVDSYLRVETSTTEWGNNRTILRISQRNLTLSFLLNEEDKKELIKALNTTT